MEESETTKPVLIFIPALGTSGEVWWQQVPAFEPHFRVGAFSGPGYSLVFARDYQPELSDYVTYLHQFVQSLSAPRVVLVGISLGGMIAQMYAAGRPDAVQALVLASTTAAYPEESRRQLRDRAQTVEHDGMAALVEPILARWFTDDFRTRHGDVVDRIRSMLAQANPIAYAQAARAISRVDTRNQLEAIRAPTLIIGAEHDTSVPPDARAVLERGIPRAQVVVIDGTAHLCNVQRPEVFNAAIDTFLQDQSIGRGPGSVRLASPGEG